MCHSPEENFQRLPTPLIKYSRFVSMAHGSLPYFIHISLSGLLFFHLTLGSPCCSHIGPHSSFSRSQLRSPQSLCTCSPIAWNTFPPQSFSELSSFHLSPTNNHRIVKLSGRTGPVFSASGRSFRRPGPALKELKI